VAGRLLSCLAREEEGFTLIELLLAAQIVIILLLVALPTYMQFRDNAQQATAKSNAKEVAFAAGLYYQSKATYAGMTIPLLKGFDAGLTTTGTFVNNSGVEVVGVTSRVTMDASHYCVYAISGRWIAYQKNPTGTITTTSSAASVCS
jgi:type II secretory pathway pseudopilin PulG